MKRHESIHGKNKKIGISFGNTFNISVLTLTLNIQTMRYNYILHAKELAVCGDP